MDEFIMPVTASYGNQQRYPLARKSTAIRLSAFS
jgi:hypothetical protein